MTEPLLSSDDPKQALYNAPHLLAIYYVENIQFWKNDRRTTRTDLNVISEKFSGKRGQILLPSSCLETSEATENDLTLSLANINLIDTSKTTWEQILAFRKDQDARRKLRNLRLFLHENYQDKTRSFIEDDLGKRLDDYNDTCKDWGFDTVTSTISAALDSNSISATILASAGAAIFGESVVVTGTVLAGASVEIGKLIISLIQKRHAFNKIRQDHEMAYIIEARKKVQ
jgi:hypothetical protein